jgi:hypothetical protein
MCAGASRWPSASFRAQRSSSGSPAASMSHHCYRLLTRGPDCGVNRFAACGSSEPRHVHLCVCSSIALCGRCVLCARRLSPGDRHPSHAPLLSLRRSVASSLGQGGHICGALHMSVTPATPVAYKLQKVKRFFTPGKSANSAQNPSQTTLYMGRRLLLPRRSYADRSMRQNWTESGAFPARPRAPDRLLSSDFCILHSSFLHSAPAEKT